jgi:hypothetical protein
MLSFISWSQYFTYILIATISYYLFIWLVLFKGRLSFAGPRFQSMGEDAPDEVMSISQHVMNELRPLFNERLNKPELLTAIQSILCKYKDWDEPSFRLPLTDFIVQELASKCSIRLGEEDQRALW